MEWHIRDARPEDMEAVHALVLELAEFEQAGEEVETDAEEFRENAFGPVPRVQVLVAEDDAGSICGIASYGWWYSTWKGRILYLDDLVVREGWRQQGLGRRLLQAMAQRAVDAGAREMRWQVLDWNHGARRFYELIGTIQDPSWVSCHLGGPALQRLAAEADSATDNAGKAAG